MTEYLYRWNPIHAEKNPQWLGTRLSDPLTAQLEDTRQICRGLLADPARWEPRYAYLIKDTNDGDVSDLYTQLTLIFEDDQNLKADSIVDAESQPTGDLLKATLKPSVHSWSAARRFYGGFALPEEAIGAVNSAVDGLTHFRAEEVGVQFDHTQIGKSGYVFQTGVLIFQISFLDAKHQVPRVRDRISGLKSQLQQAEAEFVIWQEAARNTTELDQEFSTSHV